MRFAIDFMRREIVSAVIPFRVCSVFKEESVVVAAESAVRTLMDKGKGKLYAVVFHEFHRNAASGGQHGGISG